MQIFSQIHPCVRIVLKNENMLKLQAAVGSGIHRQPEISVYLNTFNQECGFSFEGKKNFYSVDGDPVCGACLGTAE